MDLNQYFNEHDGVGVLSTADRDGRVNSAIFARPYVDESGTIIFVAARHRSLENLQANPSASFLFKEQGSGYKGLRLDLKLSSIIDNSEKIDKFRKENSGALYERYRDVDAVLALFELEAQRPLVGDGQ